ncbi:hypothetical protein AX777_23425 [Sphingobium yanoikuyae]|uniref:Uncharacterized protein n=1 Tax=Sphingobium yanoikuyae TaxID=13690 RepID=A0A177JEB9_SPHYA|nr:hypothetical protein AX777_23425 [Sphingobium yanoikuyae]
MVAGRLVANLSALIVRDKSECACQTWYVAAVARMVHAVQHGNLKEIKRTHPIKTSHVHAILVLIGTALMMGVNATA